MRQFAPREQEKQSGHTGSEAGTPHKIHPFTQTRRAQARSTRPDAISAIIGTARRPRGLCTATMPQLDSQAWHSIHEAMPEWVACEVNATPA